MGFEPTTPGLKDLRRASAAVRRRYKASVFRHRRLLSTAQVAVSVAVSTDLWPVDLLYLAATR